jgi:hypothetical protein
MSTNRNTRDPRQIEADLDRTRAQVGHTLDMLQHKFSPGELFDQALNYVRSNGGGEFASNFKQTIARNPLPVALIGVGLAWLMMSGRRGSVPGEYSSRNQYSDTTSQDEVAEGMEEASPASDEGNSTVYGGERSSVTGPSDEVAEGLDEANPTTDQAGQTTSGTRIRT